MLRWAVNIAVWQPTPAQWSLVLSCLPQEAQDRCLRYRTKDDQKRAVISHVLQRACVSRLLGEDWQQVNLQRTRGSKPFYAGSKSRSDAPNFNFNVSHEVCLNCFVWVCPLLWLKQTSNTAHKQQSRQAQTTAGIS